MIKIICHGCATVGAVNRVTAGLRCTCGSTDLDLFDPGAQSFLAAMGVEANSGGTGWGKSMPDPLRGWSEYPGPMPGRNDMSNHEPSPMRCPVCHGSGEDSRDNRNNGTCRECGGSGILTPTTTPAPPEVARHNYPSTQTTVPFVGRRRRATRHSSDPLGSAEEHIKATTPGYNGRSGGSGPDDQGMYPKADSRSPMMQVREQPDYTAPAKPLMLDAAPCPECHHAPTQVVKDRNEDGWWHCPNCGPLTNIDRNPEVNPFQPDNYTGRDKGFKEAGRRSAKKTGRVLRMYSTVRRSNPGMTQREVLSLVLRTVQKYPE